MKTQRRLLTWILVAVLVVAMLALVACVDKPEPVHLTELDISALQLEDNQMVVVIKIDDSNYDCYVVTLGEGGTDATTAEGVITYLNKQGALAVDWEDSDYGKYIHSIGGISEDTANGAYIIVFTSVEADQGTYAGVPTRIAGDITIVESGVGISSMTVQPGAVIYFEIISYAY